MTTTLVSSALTATGLRKSFGDNVVLDGIDLDIAEGTVFSLLGPNGAGKTTAIQIFSTLLHPDGGKVHIGGFDLSVLKHAQIANSIIMTIGVIFIATEMHAYAVAKNR